MSQPPPPNVSPAERWLLWLALPLLVGASALFRLRDPDVWWRVKTGEWIWQHGGIPHTDPFSHTSEGHWNCVEPVANLLLYAFDELLGAASLSWFGALEALVFAVAAVALVWEVTHKGPRFGPAVVAIGLCAGASNFRFGPKPEVFSLAGLALLLALLHAVERRRQPRLLMVVPLLLLTWGLLHRGSTVGLAALGAAAASWIVARDTRPLVAPLLGAIVASLVLLLATPGVSGSLTSSASVVATSIYVQHLGEWGPLTPGIVWGVIPMLGVLFVVWVSVAPVQRRLHFGTLVVLGTGFMAVRHVRFVPLFAVAMMPEVAWGLSRVLAAHRETIERRARPVLLKSLLAAAAFGAIAQPYLQRPVSTWGPGLHRFRRPVRAAEFLAEHPPPGKMFNTFNYGSYLLYKLAPAQKVFIDGRNDQVYRPEFFAKVSVAPRQPAVLKELVESYDVTYAVLECTTVMVADYTWLYQNPDWRLVYLDDQAAIMVKRTPETRAYLQQHAYHELRPDTGLLRANSLAYDPRAAEFSREVFRNLAEAPDSIRANYFAAQVYRHRGQRNEYEAARRRVLELAAERRMRLSLP